MNIKGIFFDTSDTLYSSPELEQKISDAPIDFIMHMRGVTAEEASNILETGKEKATANGSLLTKSNILKEAGFENSDWQNFIAEIDTTKYLTPIKENIETLEYLSSKYRLGIITNINTKFLLNILNTLGLSKDLFSYLITSDDTPESKPHPAPFLLAIEKAGALPEEIYYVGDNVKKDIAPAKKIGMKAILVDYKNFHGDKSGEFDNRIKNIEELKSIF